MLLTLAAAWLACRGWRRRLLAEEALHESDTRLKAAQQLAQLGSWELDLKSNVLTWSDEIFRIFEIDQAKFGASYEAFLNAIHPDDRELVNTSYTESVKNRTAYHIEHRLLLPDGRIKYVAERGETSYLPGGEPARSIGTVQDITAQKEYEVRIQHMAHFDSLTDLPNRELFYDRLRQVLAQAKRDARLCALIFLDLDSFKEVNDTLGHHAGDLLLQAVAIRLKASVRETDTVSRFAGDEFTVLLPNLNEQNGAEVVAEKIITALAQPFILDGHEMHIGCSAGIAFYPADADSDEALIKCADTAMYEAKKQGRGMYCLYQPHKRLEAKTE
jgi:diguanylate cyclase (GGDEF)-like protein/PAS domain S-box-containing protein